MAEQTTILVTKDTQKKLTIIKTVHDFKTHDDVINNMIDQQYSATIKVMGESDDTNTKPTD